MRLIGRPISHHRQKRGLSRMIPNVKIQSTNRHRHRFLRGNPEWENHREERGRIHYLLCVTRGFSLYKFSSPFFSSFLEECWSISKLLDVTYGADPSP